MQEIINNYLDWFKASTIITPIESANKETVKVSTMFLDSHNDGIEFYIQKIDDNISVREAVNNYIGAGFDVMTSIKKVAKDRGLAKNVIYSEYHREDK